MKDNSFKFTYLINITNELAISFIFTELTVQFTSSNYSIMEQTMGELTAVLSTRADREVTVSITTFNLTENSKLCFVYIF